MYYISERSLGYFPGDISHSTINTQLFLNWDYLIRLTGVDSNIFEPYMRRLKVKVRLIACVNGWVKKVNICHEGACVITQWL